MKLQEIEIDFTDQIKKLKASSCGCGKDCDKCNKNKDDIKECGCGCNEEVCGENCECECHIK